MKKWILILLVCLGMVNSQAFARHISVISIQQDIAINRSLYSGDVLIVSDTPQPVIESIYLAAEIATITVSLSSAYQMDLTSFSRIILAGNQSQTTYNTLADNTTFFEEYVALGGILDIHAVGSSINQLPGGYTISPGTSSNISTPFQNYELLNSPNNVTLTSLNTSYVISNLSTKDLTTITARVGDVDLPVLVERSDGEGIFLISTLIDGTSNTTLTQNHLLYRISRSTQNILVLYSDSTIDKVNVFSEMLSPLGFNIDYMNITDYVPGINQLQEYKLIFISTVLRPTNPSSIGNVLSSYVDQDGSLFLFAYSFLYYDLIEEPFGEVFTEEYLPMRTFENVSIANTYIGGSSNHPVFDGIDDVTTTVCLESFVKSPYNILGRYADNTPIIVEKILLDGEVVVINSPPQGLGGDAVNLLLNLIDYYAPAKPIFKDDYVYQFVDKGEIITINFTVYDDNPTYFEYYFSGKSVQAQYLSGIPFSIVIDTNLLTSGSHWGYILAYDQKGHVTRFDFGFDVNFPPPTISSHSSTPESPSTTPSSTPASKESSVPIYSTLSLVIISSIGRVRYRKKLQTTISIT